MYGRHLDGLWFDVVEELVILYQLDYGLDLECRSWCRILAKVQTFNLLCSRVTTDFIIHNLHICVLLFSNHYYI